MLQETETWTTSSPMNLTRVQVVFFLHANTTMPNAFEHYVTHAREKTHTLAELRCRRDVTTATIHSESSTEQTDEETKRSYWAVKTVASSQ